MFRALPPALRVTFPSCATVVLPLVGRTTVHGPKGVSDRFTASVEVPATQLSMGARMSAFAQDSPATRVLTHAGNDSMTRFKKFSSTGRRTTMGAGGNSLQR